MPRILFEAADFGRANGAGRFSWHLFQHLVAQAPPDTRLSLLRNRPLKRLALRGFGRYDIWHATARGPLSFSPGARLVLTIHDLMPEVNQPAALRRMQALVDRASAVAFVSRYTEQEARKHLRLPAALATAVIPHGVDIDVNGGDGRSGMGGGREFFFSLGEFRPRKNYESLLGLLTHFPDTHLIVAGKRGCYREYDAALDRRVAELGLGNRVHFPGVISESDKAHLYRHCRAFLFPSRNEGFGLPVIEAMAFGKPVFLARMTSLPEIAGELACYWDDFTSDAMAAVVKAGLAAHGAARARAIEAWARGFSWTNAARAYLDLYRRALSQTV